jgi:predicted DCC family thiol-disulfide oxidoreductase YuxK
MNALTDASQQESLTSERHPFLLFFDGECAFCDRWVTRVRQVDQAGRMRFGAKQGRTFQRLALAHPELANVESVVLVKRRDDAGEDYLVRSAAIRELVQGLPEFRFFRLVLQIVPAPISDVGYRIFSKFRTRLFGKLDQCRVPSEQERELFVE